MAYGAGGPTLFRLSAKFVTSPTRWVTSAYRA
jgi:hypothetical protein